MVWFSAFGIFPLFPSGKREEKGKYWGKSNLRCLGKIKSQMLLFWLWVQLEDFPF